MDFYEVLERVLALLQRHGRVTYRSLTRQFDLDNEYLEDLKDALLFTYSVADEDSRGLVWTGEIGSPEPYARRGTENERHFQVLLPAVIAFLQQEGRVTYRAIKYIFCIDDALLDEIREELTLRRLAIDEQGKVLVWTGETQPITPPVVDVPSQYDTTVVTSPTVPTPLPSTEPNMTSNGPTGPTEAIATDLPQGEPAVTSEPVRSDQQAERRQLTVMFCDLADSTKLSQQLDPEDLREVIRAYQQTSAEVIQRFDGYIAQHLGDGLLIYFGWPRAHEDDAQRALHAGLGIVEAITTTLHPRLATEKGVQLTVRLGVHTGLVVVGQMGSSGRQENLATGETVNIAARLEGLAQPNTVVISNVTERLVRGAFEFEDLGPQNLQGVTEPMQVFRVLSPAEVHRDEDESLPDGGMFLVGRDEEVGLLTRRWEQSKDGLGQVVFISGEAGIGKSSLVATMRQHVMQEGYTRITFQCSTYHTNSSLYPVIAHLEQILGFDRDDSPEARLEKLEQVMRTTGLPLEESVPLVATLLSVPLEDRYPTLTMSPQQQRQQTLDTLVAWLMEEAERQPVLTVWEDLHWGDPSTLEMLGLVLEQTPTVPMLHVLTFRPEFSPPWPTRSHMTPITLNRLERPQVEALITHLTSGKALPTEVVEHIVTKTDGVPLYVEELTKMLLASDLLCEEAGQYVLTGPLSTVSIPDTLQDSLMARLDQMNTAKEVAQLGAVLGREFDYEMLEAISSQDKAILQEGLAQLVASELLYQRGRPPRAKYIFKHALIQDAAYASLLRMTRQAYHQRIAEVFAERFPETAASQPELMAHHYTNAGFSQEAVEYWKQASERAVERSANMEAIAHLNTGLELLKTLPDNPARDQQELDILTLLGPVFMRVKGYAATEVIDTYTRARELCAHLGDRRQTLVVLLQLTSLDFVRAHHRQSLELAKQCFTMAERLHEPMLRLEAQRRLGGSLSLQGDLCAAREHLEQALTLYQPDTQHGHRAVQDFRIACLSFLAWTLAPLGYLDEALACMRRASILAQSLSNPFSHVFAVSHTMYVHQFRREPRGVQQCAEETVRLATEHGCPLFVGFGLIMQGWALAVQGQIAEGIAHLHQGLETYRLTGQQNFCPYYLALLTEAYSKQGQTEKGLDTLADAFTLAADHEESYYEAELHHLKGELLIQLSSDNATEAEPCFHQAISIAQNQSAKSWELRAATSLAKLWQSQGKRDEAYELLAPVYGWFTEGFDTADLQDVKALLDELSEGSS